MSTEVELYSPEVTAILAQQDEELKDGSFRVPILKICQAMTKEVSAEAAEPGDFFNTMTEESYGNQIEFIWSLFQKGRAGTTKDGTYRTCVGQDLIPDYFADVEVRDGKTIGEEFVGTRFDEHPDSHEQYSKEINDLNLPWGKGPKITTTFNYTGLVIVPALEDEEDDEQLILPVRLTFKRSTKGAHDKLRTLKSVGSMRNKMPWDTVFELSTTQADNQYKTYIVEVKKGRDTTAEERKAASELALHVGRGLVVDNADVAEDGDAKRPEPEDTGGLAVG